MHNGKLFVKTGLTALFFLIFIPCYSQFYSGHIWYFGNSPQGVVFNKSDSLPRTVNNQGSPFGSGGSAVATDPVTMELYFYTDGANVYDATHQPMSGGAMNGNPSGNQPVAVSTVPGSSDRYIIFTNSASEGAPGSISFSVIDMSAQGNSPMPGEPLGEIEILNGPNHADDVAQGMAVISDGDVSYLVYQDVSTNELIMQEIQGATTLGPSITAAIPSALSAANISFITLSDGTIRLAVAPEEAGANVQLFTFDPATESLTSDGPVLNSASGEGIYDTEWSSDGRYLYISDEEGQIYQYDTQNPAATLAEILPPGGVEASYGLQRGPDNRIYHIYQDTPGGAYQLGQINFPDSAANLTSYEQSALTTADLGGTQFPSFLPQGQQEIINGLGFTATDFCENNVTKFFPEADDTEPLPTSYLWDFGDGNTSSDITPAHEYDSPGNYLVRLYAIRGQDTTIYDDIIPILANEDSVDLGQDTVICPDETLTLDIGDVEGIITWSTGASGKTIEVDTTGYYWVSIELANGCTVYDGIQVDEYGYDSQRANFWYFGDQAGIDFNGEGPSAVTDGLMTAPEGTATMSDGNGDLLFYTDGNSVWGIEKSTGNHVLIDTDIGGANSATQSSIIVPYPNDETLFFIFTVEEGPGDPGSDNTYNLNYTLIDIKSDIPEVVVKNKPLFSPSTERLTAINMNDGTVLLAHELGNNTFWAYPIDSTGIGEPVLSSVGSDHNVFPSENSEGYMKFSPDGTKVAVALPGPENTVEIFDFVDSTLTLTNPVTLTFPDNFPEYEVYGVEFSSGTNKLYVTLKGSGESKLYEIRLDSMDADFMMENAWETTVPEELGAVQIAPDGQIYVAINGSGFLGIISVSEDTAMQSEFIEQGFDLEGKTSTLGLPNFIQNISPPGGEPVMSVSGAQCIGSDVSFVSQPTSQIDEFRWTIQRISDNSVVHSATESETNYVFNTAGQYRATLNMYNRCGLDTILTQDFEIFGSPEPPTLPGVSSLCGADVMLDADTLNRPGLSFLWSTGETTRTITVSAEGTYNVTLTDANGCTSDGETFVADGRPEVDLGPDQTVCQNEPMDDLSTGISEIAEFTWYINGVDQDREASSIPVNTSNPGNFEYVVMVLDTFTSCVAYDTVNIVVNAEPNLETNLTHSSCGSTDGILSVISNPDNYDYEWFDADNISLGQNTSVNNVGSGIYNLQITDPVSGCTNTKSVSIQDDPAPFTITSVNQIPGCSQGEITVSINGIPAPPQNVDYNIYSINTNSLVASGTYNALAVNVSFNTVSVPADEYLIEIIIEDGLGAACRQSREISVEQLPETQFDINQNSLCPPTDVVVVPTTGNAKYAYIWTGPPGFSSDSSAISPTESGTYTITVDSDDLCPNDSTIQLQIGETPVVTIEPQDNGCDGSLVLRAETNQTDNFSFMWSNGVTGPVISFDTPGPKNNISVRAVNQQTGCEATAGPEDFNVYPEIIVDLSSSVGCEDGEPIILRAQGNVSNLMFNWFTGTGQNPLNAQSIDTFAVQDEGIYRVIASNSADCRGEAQIQVARFPLTPSDLLASYVYCEADPIFENTYVELTPSNSFVEYAWLRLPDGQVVSQSSVFEISGGEEGDFVGRFTNAYGCVTSDTISVDNDCIPRVHAPNAFSPNGDGNNDLFRVFPMFVSDFEIFIFSRWGELLFQSDSPDFTWDGRFNGELLPVGTYPYVMRYKSITDPQRGTIEKRGGILLLR